VTERSTSNASQYGPSQSYGAAVRRSNGYRMISTGLDRLCHVGTRLLSKCNRRLKSWRRDAIIVSERGFSCFRIMMSRNNRVHCSLRIRKRNSGATPPGYAGSWNELPCRVGQAPLPRGGLLGTNPSSPPGGAGDHQRRVSMLDDSDSKRSSNARAEVFQLNARARFRPASTSCARRSGSSCKTLIAFTQASTS
jgi:hypothetical protein